MKRRDFTTGLIGAVAASLANAQDNAIQVIGFLSGRSAGTSRRVLAAFHHGLAEGGYAEGRNIVVDYRWADGRYEQLPALAADLVRKRVAVIAVTGGNEASLAAKQATSTIPIVFIGGGDPVKLGLVSSLNHPAGNATGVSLVIPALGVKRLDVLRELLPSTTKLGILVNPHYPTSRTEAEDLKLKGSQFGVEFSVFEATGENELIGAFRAIAAQQMQALMIANDAFFLDLREALVRAAAENRIPTMFFAREFVEAGGLLSYGSNLADGYQKVGAKVAKVLKGAAPGELPVEEPTSFELLINLKTAKELRITIPPALLARADEVIE